MPATEYVARVTVERIERKLKPGEPTRTRGISTVDRHIREKTEIAAFSIRAASLDGVRERVQGMMIAALPVEGVAGEPVDDDEDEDEAF